MITYSAEAPTKDVELDVFSAFLCAGDFDPDSSEHVAFMSDVAQAETKAYMACSKAKGKGKPLSKDAHGYRHRASGLTVEDRAAKLQEIKMKSTCKACGRKGRWAGDKECPGKPYAGHRAVSQVAHLAGEIRTFEKAVQTDDLYGTSESEMGTSRRESWNSDKGSVHYGHLSKQDEGHTFMGFFDKADMVSSDEDVQDGAVASRSPPESSWGYVAFPQGRPTEGLSGLGSSSPCHRLWDLSNPRIWSLLEQWVSVRRSLTSCIKQGRFQLTRHKNYLHVAWNETSTRSPVSQVAYQDCQHLRTNNRGSDRRTHRVYCLDCCRTIDETPQILDKESLALAQKVAVSPTQQQDLTRRQLQDYTFFTEL